MYLKFELAGDFTCTCEELDVTVTTRKGSAIGSVAREIVKRHPFLDKMTEVQVFRGDTLVFKPLTLGQIAQWSIAEGEGKPRFAKYQPHTEASTLFR